MGSAKIRATNKKKYILPFPAPTLLRRIIMLIPIMVSEATKEIVIRSIDLFSSELTN